MSKKLQTMALPVGNAGALETTRDQLKPTAAPPAPDAGGFINEATALTRVPVSRRTWFAWRQKGLPYIRVGKRILYDWASVRSWLLRQQCGE